jgi:hypothetical protein
MLANWFLTSSGTILAVTGSAKVWAALRDAKGLGWMDPIIGLEFRHVLLIVGVLEALIALQCFIRSRAALSTALIASFATGCAVYRFGLHWMHWRVSCGCLGRLTQLLQITPEFADEVATVLLVYLLVGSYWLLLSGWRSRPDVSSTTTA